MTSQSEHWDRLASHPPDASVIDPNDTRGHKNRYITTLRNHALLEALADAGRDAPVLDFGCGTGGIAAALVATGRRVVGVDISTGLLARTRERALGDAALFLHFNGSHLPLATASVSAAVTYVVLNHLMDDDDLVAMLREIHRVLRPGGHLVAIEQVRRRATVDPVVWQHRRTLDGFVAIFKGADFRIEQADIVRYGRLPTIHAVRLGLVPVRLFHPLQRMERRLGQWFGVLPWDYCDVRFVLRRP